MKRLLRTFLAVVAVPLVFAGVVVAYQSLDLSPVDPFACNGATEGATYQNTTSHTAKYCNGTAWTDLGGDAFGPGNTMPRGTLPRTDSDTRPYHLERSRVSDQANAFFNRLYVDGGVFPQTNLIFNFSPLNDGTERFFEVHATLQSAPTAGVLGALFQFVSAGSAPETQGGLQGGLDAGYTGTAATWGMIGYNVTAGTSQNSGSFGTHAFGGGSTTGNAGVFGTTYGAGDGDNIGVLGYSQNLGNGSAIGGIFQAPFFLGTVDTKYAVGVIGMGGDAGHDIAIGGAFGMGSTESPALEDSVILGDSCHFVTPLLTLKQIGTTHLQMYNGTLYMGNRGGVVAPVTRGISGEPAINADVVGGSLTLEGGPSTGVAASSAVVIRSTDPVGSGTTPQTPYAALTIASRGDIQVNRTVTAIGTTGAQTIDKAAGTINVAAGQGAVVLTNALITTSSIVFTTLRVADGTCTFVKSAVPIAGSVTFTLDANCTATQSIGFLVTN